MKIKSLLISVAIFSSLICPAGAQKLDLEQIEQSIRYINDLQNTDGGFRPAATETLSDLGAVNSSMRALKYLHPRARPRNLELPKEFVLKCYNRSTGSFSNRPGDKPDVRSTAMGLMAMVELKMPLAEYADPIQRYFAENAKSLSDIYIAAAALHAAELTTPKAGDWISLFEKTHNADGTYGKEAFESAGAVITILRLGGKVSDEAGVAHNLRGAQQEDGGFARPGETSNLSTTYRIMRAFYMLREKPDVTRLTQFIARCRNEDGGYGAAPGQPSSTSATYFAAIVMHWLNELEQG